MHTSADNSPQDDYELMRRVADGDSAALGMLYDKFSSMVFAMGLRVLRDRLEAEELLVDIFFEIWDRSARYDASRGAPVSYLMNIAHSRAIDRLRSRGFKRKFAALSAGDDPAAPATDPAAGIVRDERCERVKKAMITLDTDQRQAVELSFFDGLSHSEIATKLNKPLGTVKTYIRQGLIRMRDCLRTDSEGEP